MPDPNHCCILVAEDDAILRYLTVRALRQHGYRVLEAPDGAEALRVAEQHPHLHIDLLISDLDMPRMDGNELVRQLRNSRPDLKVLIVTGRMLDDFPDLTTYVVDVVPKPVNPRSLLSRVSALLGA